MPETKSSSGILAEDKREERERIVAMLTKAYWMEVETVMSYIANSTNPGSLDFTAEQSCLQPPERQSDIVHVIEGVIAAETGAIDFYNEIIQDTEQSDPVTNDQVIAILRDEEGHRRLFEGFLREYEDAAAS